MPISQVLFLMEGLEPPDSPNGKGNLPPPSTHTLYLLPSLHSVSPHLDAIKAAVSSHGDLLTPREHAYIRAALEFSKGELLYGTEELRNMLIDYPLGKIIQTPPPSLSLSLFLSLLNNNHADALAMRINVGLYITLGEYERMRDMMASALVSWTEDMSMYPFILS